MEFYNALDEGFGDKFGGILLAAGILLTSLGINRQNETHKMAMEFLKQNPVYIQKLEDLKSLDRFDKVSRNEVISKWKSFVSEQDLDSRLEKGLKTAGEGQLANYNRGR